MFHLTSFIHGQFNGFIDDINERFCFALAGQAVCLIYKQKAALRTDFPGLGEIPGDKQYLSFSIIKLSKSVF